jgi:hypothetical protein
MTRRSLVLCAAVGFAMSLAAGPAAAAPDWPGLHPSAEIRAFFAPVWDFLSSLVSSGDSTLPGETFDNRCGIDPDGHTFCGDAPPPNG